MKDIEIMKAKEGVEYQVLLLKNKYEDSDFSKEETFYNTEGVPVEENYIHIGISNRIFVDPGNLLR